MGEKVMFKVGDRVRMVKPSQWLLSGRQVGKTYTVSKSNKSSDSRGAYIHLSETGGDEGYGEYSDKFELAKEDHVSDAIRYYNYNTYTATGQELDRVGEISGLKRIVEDDASYRQRISELLNPPETNISKELDWYQKQVIGIFNAFDPGSDQLPPSLVLCDGRTITGTPMCNHSWKTYDSGWSKYEYCEKCPEKKV